MATERSINQSSPVAVVTGGASGMGLSIVRRLIELGYHITVIDFSEKSFHSLSKELSEAKKEGRIDVVYANAGVPDTIDFYAPTQERADGAPEKPNVDVIDVCLMGVVWCAYLSLHYFRKSANKRGKFMATSSMAGLYPAEAMPLYTAAKHGVVGLCRAMGKHCKYHKESIMVNAICPGLVDTGLTQGLMKALPPDMVTPHSTVVNAFEMFLNDDAVTGMVAECSGDNVYLIDHQKWSDDKAEFVMDPGLPVRLQEQLDEKDEAAKG